ncbi:MAG: hypothetical protein H0U16_00665, partial [Actinobacteria bacterium]|nr:hypothetical protein [Actinomycetota bacterium]
MLRGAGAVVALVLLEWTVGWIGVAAWTQSWSVVRRGHFRITAWGTVLLGLLAALAFRSASAGVGSTRLAAMTVTGFFLAVLIFLAVQYSRTDVPGAIAGAAACGLGSVALVMAAGLVAGWPHFLAALELVAGAALLGSVTNGMMLGHWYLNQPGLKPWALARLTNLALGAAAGA